MTFEALLNQLLNGLHDANLISVLTDYENMTVEMRLDNWMDVDQSDDEKEKYTPALITFFDFEFCIIDKPDANYPYRDAGPLVIDAGVGHPATSKIESPEFLEKNFLCWIWVNDWNSFIRIASRDVTMKWIAI